jgi:carbamate kinase
MGDRITTCKMVNPTLKAAVVLVHDHGPQLGLLALQNSTYTKVAPYPLDVLGAESQGMIGYMLIQQLKNLMPSRNVTALLAHHIGSHSCLSGNQPSASSPFLNPS